MSNPFRYPLSFTPVDPARPWWYAIPHGFARVDGAQVTRSTRPHGWAVSAPGTEIDGKVLTLADLAQGDGFDHITVTVDRLTPAPCPPALCGQVWTFGAYEILILGTGPATDGSKVALGIGADEDGRPILQPFAQEELSAAFLVAGPGAPWGPSAPLLDATAPSDEVTPDDLVVDAATPGEGS